MKYSALILLVFLGGCLQSPTKLVFEEGNIKGGNTIVAPAEDAESELIIGDRKYVQSVLVQIFGNTTEIQNIVFTRVTQKIVFNGAFDIYANPTEFKQDDRTGGTRLTSVPIVGAGRAAMSIKTCELVTDSDTAINYALTQASIIKTNPITTFDIQKAYAQFLPYREPNSDVLAALLAVGKTGTTPFEGWRLIYLTLCISPEWQII